MAMEDAIYSRASQRKTGRLLSKMSDRQHARSVASPDENFELYFHSLYDLLYRYFSIAVIDQTKNRDSVVILMSTNTHLTS